MDFAKIAFVKSYGIIYLLIETAIYDYKPRNTMYHSSICSENTMLLFIVMYSYTNMVTFVLIAMDDACVHGLCCVGKII